MTNKKELFYEVLTKGESNTAYRFKEEKNYSVDEIQKTFRDLELHQIELEMQNKELSRAYLELNDLKKRYFDLYHLAPIAYLTLGKGGIILEANYKASRLFGLNVQSLIQKTFSSFILKEDQDIYYMYKKNILHEIKRQPCELRMLHSDGSVFWAQIESNTHDSNGLRVYRLIISSIARRKKVEEDLRIAAIAFESQNGMAITDENGIIQKINPSFTTLTGYTEDESVGQTMSILKSKRHGPMFYQRMWESINKTNRWQGEIWNKRKNGQIYPELLTITAVISSDHSVCNYIASFSDITEDKKAEAKIHRLAYYDHLTSIPNRRLLQDRLTQSIATKSRDHLLGAMLFIDLDKFKLLNDTYGHDIGDLLLIKFAQRLKKLVRKSDTVARQGGDEFMILLEDLSKNIEEAATLANQLGEKIFESMEEPFLLQKHEYYSQMSIGITLFDGKNTVEDLFKRADIALYQAKHSGGNTLRFFDPQMQANLDTRSML